MTTPTPPTQQDLWEDRLESVHRETDDQYRHGCYIYQVFHRKEDDTYWAVNYNLSTDGEENGLSDDDYTIEQVNRVETMEPVVKYVKVGDPQTPDGE